MYSWISITLKTTPNNYIALLQYYTYFPHLSSLNFLDKKRKNNSPSFNIYKKMQYFLPTRGAGKIIDDKADQ